MAVIDFYTDIQFVMTLRRDNGYKHDLDLVKVFKICRANVPGVRLRTTQDEALIYLQTISLIA